MSSRVLPTHQCLFRYSFLHGCPGRLSSMPYSNCWIARKLRNFSGSSSLVMCSRDFHRQSDQTVASGTVLEAGKQVTQSIAVTLKSGTLYRISFVMEILTCLVQLLFHALHSFEATLHLTGSFTSCSHTVLSDKHILGSCTTSSTWTRGRTAAHSVSSPGARPSGVYPSIVV